ncbi:alkaline phosphatase family protein [Nesterenkonia marinintestina]|uniref:alkaline phosphatase family protein n=1 Tax=Nesterenkonia marinintestina TaxID=2979865 RepID=UPI0021C0A23F|nr:nucleotide pyrophosphatase/phosphodiesterase family protein [Nesterenkonia sp. GX14115]
MTTPTAPGSGQAPRPVDYDGAHLRHVMGSAAAACGLHGFDERLGLPSADIMVVVMVDGLGDELLARRSGHARFLARSRRSDGSSTVLDAAVPTTTANSLACLGTGRTPGEHGLVGYDVYSPEHDRVVNMLGGWDEDVDPHEWQPHPTVLTRAEQAGATVVTVSRPGFRTSSLTRAALWGGEFLGAEGLGARFTAAADRIAAHRPQKPGARRGPATPLLMYLYVDELDKAGHRWGTASSEWADALETLDAELQQLCEGLERRYGSRAAVVLTADHGMVDVAPEDRVDVAESPELLVGVAHTAGEPRLMQLILGPETSPTRAARLQHLWEDRFGDQAWIRSRDEAVEDGWFGVVEPRVRGRIGDLLIAQCGGGALFDTMRTGRGPLGMVGHHGSLTEAEREVPLLVLTGQGLDTG